MIKEIEKIVGTENSGSWGNEQVMQCIEMMRLEEGRDYDEGEELQAVREYIVCYLADNLFDEVGGSREISGGELEVFNDCFDVWSLCAVAEELVLKYVEDALNSCDEGSSCNGISLQQLQGLEKSLYEVLGGELEVFIVVEAQDIPGFYRVEVNYVEFWCYTTEDTDDFYKDEKEARDEIAEFLTSA